MLIAILPVTDYSTAKQQLFQLVDSADGVELRLDYASHWDGNAVAELRKMCTLPVIFTLRSQAQGGHYPHSEEQRLQTILELCAFNPDYLDLEHNVPHEFILVIRQCYPAIKIIVSYHNFAETPADLAGLFQAIYHEDCYAYKIATQAHSTLDALRMLHWVLTVRTRKRVIGLCMGEEGQCTRILAPVVGSLFSYTFWDQSQATASGQLPLQDLTTTYHYRQLNSSTKIYALLGDPVHLSVGHIFHNRAIEIMGQNAVYIKLRVTAEELPAAMVLLRHLPIGGLSITMPLKETVVPLLDELSPDAQAIQAVNTVVRGRQWIGWNTDGLGAMQALSEQCSLAGQTILLLGAGGAARAIAYAALAEGAKVIILNRSIAKAKILADELGCEAYALEVFHALKSYTLCINTLPETAFQDPTMQAIWQSNPILPGTVVMDIVYQPLLETTFLLAAKAAGCVCIPGFKMYIAQALLQIQHWFQPEATVIQEIKLLMQKIFSSQ
ncbi:MAG: shikimate dehydrogenase [Legionellaceae bacterium]|nr:shikimate dehydrogenase [Legionellaceae bacterium]MBP9774744.1 shikimate dehydrogenase [Legionellaceae bacterium]